MKLSSRINALAGTVLLAAGTAHAQAAAPAPVAAPDAPPAPAAEPAPAPAAEPPPAPAVVANTEARPATAEEKLPPITVGAWLRMGARLQGRGDPKKLNDLGMDTVYGELHTGGKIHKNVSVTLNLNANGLAGTAGIEDAIIGLDFIDEAHLWIGQELVMVDRANTAGPFFMIPWNYPGFLSVGGAAVAMAPKEGPSGRNKGATLWGNIDGGSFKYFAGVFAPDGPSNSLLLSGRVTANFIGKEPGYFGNATYFGDKDVLSLNAGAQYQKRGSVGAPPAAGGPPPTADYGELNIDALAEFRVLDGGWVTGDAAYYHFAGSNELIKNGFYAVAAFATPKIGVGNIQPMLRYQYGKGDGVKISAIDAAVSYLVMGPGLRFTANYQHTDLGPGLVGNAVQLGAQAIFF
jgi:hypothetical protein